MTRPVTAEELTDEMVHEELRRNPFGTTAVDCATVEAFRRCGRWWWGEVITANDDAEARARIAAAINARGGGR